MFDTTNLTQKSVEITATPWARDVEDTYYVEFREIGGDPWTWYQFPVKVTQSALRRKKARNDLHKKLIEMLTNIHPYAWCARRLPLMVEERDSGWWIPSLGVMAYRYNRLEVGSTLPIDANIAPYVSK